MGVRSTKKKKRRKKKNRNNPEFVRAAFQAFPSFPSCRSLFPLTSFPALSGKACSAQAALGKLFI